jgi:hypothetical protein
MFAENMIRDCDIHLFTCLSRMGTFYGAHYIQYFITECDSFYVKNMLITQKVMLHIYSLMFLYSLKVLKAILKSVVASVHLSV